MLIKCLAVGHMEANCYVVTDENTLECAVIDPGDEVNTIMDYVEDLKLKVRAIFLTHGHYDHTGAALGVSQETGAPIYISKKDTTDEEEPTTDEDGPVAAATPRGTSWRWGP